MWTVMVKKASERYGAYVEEFGVCANDEKVERAIDLCIQGVMETKGPSVGKCSVVFDQGLEKEKEEFYRRAESVLKEELSVNQTARIYRINLLYLGLAEILRELKREPSTQCLNWAEKSITEGVMWVERELEKIEGKKGGEANAEPQ